MKKVVSAIGHFSLDHTDCIFLMQREGRSRTLKIGRMSIMSNKFGTTTELDNDF